MRGLHAQFRRSLPPIEGVTSSAVRVLGVIARAQDDGAAPSHIADELTMTSSNVAAALRELETAGHIVRRRDIEDARRVAAFLTAHGAETVESHRALRFEGLRDAIDNALTPAEQAQLISVLPLLRRVVDAGHSDGNR